MFLMNTWYVAAFADEIAAGSVLGRQICGERIVLFRSAEGRIAAMEDRCCHRHYPLANGKVVGERLQCGYHGLEFDGTGRCVKVPSQAAVPADARVRSYPVVERHKLIWIWMGEPARADATQIVDFGWLDHPLWRHKGTRYHVQANYRLIIENLLDLTHLTFVHASTIGNYATTEAADTKTERGANDVTVTRWMVDTPPPPTYQKAGHFDGNVDRWQIINWQLPALIRLSVGAMATGHGARDLMRADYSGKVHRPRDVKSIGMFNFNMITPETERSTHYFWAQGHDFAIDNPEVTELVFSQVAIAFKQDWEVFELQQRNIDEKPDAPRIDLNGDAGGIQALRMLDREIAAEARGGRVAA